MIARRIATYAPSDRPTIGYRESSRTPSRVHRDKCAPGPVTPILLTFRRFLRDSGPINSSVFALASNGTRVRVFRGEGRGEPTALRERRGVNSRGTALQRISTAQTERLGPLSDQQRGYKSTHSEKRNALVERAGTEGIYH